MAIDGRFAGKHATYTSDNYCAFVVNQVNSEHPEYLGQIQYWYYDNEMQMWSHTTVSTQANHYCKPSLYYTPQEIVVAYSSGTNKMLAISTNNGLTWQSYEAGRTFDLNPTVFKEGEDYVDFELKLPYPQWMMTELVSSDDSSDPVFPQNFTNFEKSMHDTDVYYWGKDVIYQPLRSNGDILIKNGGGGTNGGWPTFYAPVITSGTVISVNGDYPIDDVFRGGLVENAPHLDYPQIDDSQSVLVGPEEYSDTRIIKIRVDGDSYTAWMGTISVPVQTQFPVYEVYPEIPPSDPIYINTVAVSDTIWTTIASGSCANMTLKVNSELWIEGTFSGKQTWIAQGDIFIIGDILLENTQAGTSPEEPMNYSDQVQLISAKSVKMKYGYKDPQTGNRVHLARSDAEPFQVYASVLAFGDGGDNPRNDGIFTFEYQHPHGSTPAVNVLYDGENHYFDNIDLHRYRFPPTVADPWPLGSPFNSDEPRLDMPWYNPLWPEAKPYLERGTINLYGSIAQRRRGYIHRSGNDSDYPSNDGIWDIPNDMCGGPVIPPVPYQDPVIPDLVLLPQNYPGSTGIGVGYKKSFQADGRLGFKDLDNLQWNLGLSFGRLVSNGEGGFDTQDYQLVPYIGIPYTPKSISHGADMSLFALNNNLVLKNQTGEVELLQQDSAEYIALQVKDPNTAYYIKLLHQTKDNSIFIEHIDLQTGESNMLDMVSNVPSMMADLMMLPDSRVLYAYLDPQLQVVVHEIMPNGDTPELCTYNASEIVGTAELSNSRMFLGAMGNENMNILFQLASDMDLHGVMQIENVQLAVPAGNPAYEVPSIPNMSMKVYPNPFSSAVKIEVAGAASELHELKIYNLRGQLVHKLSGAAADETGLRSYDWNGCDSQGHKLPSGIYFIRYENAGMPHITRKVSIF
jgi:hypothetical protein